MAAQTAYPLKHPVKLQFRQADGSIREEEITNVSLRRPTGKGSTMLFAIAGSIIRAVMLLEAAQARLAERGA